MISFGEKCEKKKMAKNVSHSAWQVLEGDGGILGAREI